MYSRILFVPDFARRFFVRCAQIQEAYLDGTLIKFMCIWPKISRKSRYKSDSESTSLIYGGETWKTIRLAKESKHCVNQKA